MAKPKLCEVCRGRVVRYKGLLLCELCDRALPLGVCDEGVVAGAARRAWRYATARKGRGKR